MGCRVAPTHKTALPGELLSPNSPGSNAREHLGPFNKIEIDAGMATLKVLPSDSHYRTVR